MKTETKQQQVERLQGNMLRWYRMSGSDRGFMDSIPTSKLVYLGFTSGEWDMRPSRPFVDNGIYRIHRDYKPEPDTPVFPGYVLCEVKLHDGLLKYSDGLSLVYLGHAINRGCCGYVFKEAMDFIANAPCMWADGTELYPANFRGNCKPATLAYVCFREETK